MQFRVIGVHRETGRTVKPLIVETDSEQTALEIATKAGMMVERIELIARNPPAPIVFTPVDDAIDSSKQAHPRNASLLYLADWYGFVAFINLVASVIVVFVCLGKFIDKNDPSVLAFAIAFGIGAATTILTLFALAEGIRLMIEVASTLREIRDRLPKN